MIFYNVVFIVKSLFILLILLFTGTFISNSARGQGHLWGVTIEGGKDGAGVIFKTNADGSNYTVVREFEVNLGKHPRYTTLTKASSGKLYGVTSDGGKYQEGVLFEFDPATGSYEKKVDFEFYSRGANPYGSLVEARNGKLYGMTTRGGNAYDDGVIFEFDPATGSFEKKVELTAEKGSNPYGGMALANNGKLYGMTERGGTGDGVIFEFDPQTGEYTKLLNLSAEATGANPRGTLTLSSSGIFYGLTKSGGAHGGGVLFSFDPDTHQLTRKVDFSPPQTGFMPIGSVVEDADGKLYGMTSDGGAYSGPEGYYGVLFSYDPVTEIFERKIDFGYYHTGSTPFGSLIRASNGSFYGMNSNGGLGGGVDQVGVLFQYTPENGLIAKHYFEWKTGGTPYGSLTEVNGKLYGMTMLGGLESQGTLFEYDLASEEYKNKIDFSSAPDGANPMFSLTVVNEKLFGVTTAGGLYGGGTVFEYDTATAEFSKRFDFSLLNDQAAYPASELVLASNGKLYGVTSQSVTNSNGTFYEFDPASGQFTKKTDLIDIGVTGPPRKMILASNAKIYGTARFGGKKGEGVLFEYNPLMDKLTPRIEFESSSFGGEPAGFLVEGTDGLLYGFTKKGGNSNAGILYQFDPVTGAHEKKLDLYDLKFIGGPESGIYESLTSGHDGKLYGMCAGGGANGMGFVFSFDPVSNDVAKVQDFSWETGAFANGAPMLLTPDGNLYGLTTEGGINNKGVMFQFNPSINTYAVTHNFDVDAGYNTAWVELTYVPSPLVLSAENSPKKKLNLYPIPAENVLYLQEVEEIRQAYLVNELSQRVALPFLKTGNTYEINIQGCHPGFCILQLVTDKEIQNIKFIKN
jgi:uncharacterized repeat protein (TIGR03803 family)